jgi:D-aminopeptidase
LVRVERADKRTLIDSSRVADQHLNGLFRATIEATAEAVLNAMIAADTMVGLSGNVCHALPHDRLREVMRCYGRLRE